MDNEFIEILMQLQKEILLALDLEPLEPISYELNQFQEILYLFYLDSTKSPTKEQLKQSSDILSTNFALFVLQLKQKNQSIPILSKATSEYLCSFSEKLLKLLEDLSLLMPSDFLLLDLDSAISCLPPNDSEILKFFISGKILKEKHHLQEMLLELENTSNPHFYAKSQFLMKKVSDYWESSVKSLEDQLSVELFEGILKDFKKTGEDFKYLLASISALDSEPLEEELEEIEELLVEISNNTSN